MFKADASLGTKHRAQISIPPLRLQHLRQHLPCTWTVQSDLLASWKSYWEICQKSLSFFHLMISHVRFNPIIFTIYHAEHISRRDAKLLTSGQVWPISWWRAPLVQSQQVKLKLWKMFARLFGESLHRSALTRFSVGWISGFTSNKYLKFGHMNKTSKDCVWYIWRKSPHFENQGLNKNQNIRMTQLIWTSTETDTSQLRNSRHEPPLQIVWCLMLKFFQITWTSKTGSHHHAFAP